MIVKQYNKALSIEYSYENNKIRLFSGDILVKMKKVKLSV
ncbi:hypothetical protein SALWKB12_1215 [Snodgrassella communis]|jgi:hypothetical protein|uniref:Uncharacterized protein n=1 Tax=Snodgrassella communis TaxID=2946699 RepID=A0A837AGJ7_9NEIS|nr:hypothetical protein SALWKB12_1215 [Snodgrassella communis]KDN15356.1 hypothetical protein SALWKB29_0460 [Snodgrassella communis]